jgi:hypothetical protein
MVINYRTNERGEKMKGLSPNGKVFNADFAYQGSLISFEEYEAAIARYAAIKVRNIRTGEIKLMSDFDFNPKELDVRIWEVFTEKKEIMPENKALRAEDFYRARMIRACVVDFHKAIIADIKATINWLCKKRSYCIG